MCYYPNELLQVLSPVFKKFYLICKKCGKHIYEGDSLYVVNNQYYYCCVDCYTKTSSEFTTSLYTGYLKRLRCSECNMDYFVLNTSTSKQVDINSFTCTNCLTKLTKVKVKKPIDLSQLEEMKKKLENSPGVIPLMHNDSLYTWANAVNVKNAIKENEMKVNKEDNASAINLRFNLIKEEIEASGGEIQSYTVDYPERCFIINYVRGKLKVYAEYKLEEES